MSIEPARERLRIAIATGGRFHVLDLARELHALGHEVRFYSYVRRAHVEKFGLPVGCYVSLFPMMAPIVGWQRLQPKLLPRANERTMAWALNRALMARLAPCDVLIAMSGLILEAAQYAKQRFGAAVWLERGSRHILSQREILAGFGKAESPSDFGVARELAGYALADRIVVASRHVAESFTRDPDAHAKLFVNPYGVDLDQFPQRNVPPPASPKTVLFVGGWTYRKGVDVLTEAIAGLEDVHLVHVGALGEIPFPASARFKHYDSIPQWRLSEFYNKAHVFVIASREEGLAMVQAQALASGLPLVCTDHTGGIDLAHSPALAKRIRVVPSNNAAALRATLLDTLALASRVGGFPKLPQNDRCLLSWQGYGERYANELAKTKGLSRRTCILDA
jgi:starch synthase